MSSPASDGPVRASMRLAPEATVRAHSPAALNTPMHEPLGCDRALVRAFGFLGKRWNGVLLGTLMNGPASFSQLRRAVDGISDSVLSERLGALVEAELVERTVAPGPPVAVSYALSPAGKALLPAMRELAAWARGSLPA